MWIPDVRTVFLVTVLVNIFLPLMLVIFWKTQKTYNGFTIWILSLLFFSAGYIMFVLRGSIPDILSIIAANIVLFLATVMLVDSSRRYFWSKPLPPVFYSFLILCGCFFLYYTYIFDSFPLRTLISTVFIAPCYLIVGLIAVQVQEPETWWLRLGFATTMIIAAVAMIVRSIYLLVNPEVASLFIVDLPNSFFFMITILMIILSTGFFLMLNMARSQIQLQSSERRYRAIFETTRTGIMVVEDDMTISLVNSVFERASGFSKSEIENKKKWTEFVVKEDLDRMLEQHRLRRINQENAIPHYEFRFIPRSGEIRDIDIMIDIIPGTTKSVASLTDITDRKRAEVELHAAYEQIAASEEELRARYDMLARTDKDLRKSEERYRTLVENIPDGVFLHRSGEILYANYNSASLLHLKDPSLLIGKQILDYIDPADRDAIIAGMKVAKETREPIPLREVNLICNDGTRIIVEYQTVLVEYRGEYVRQVVFRDITLRKLVERSLERAKTKLNLLNYVTFNDIQNMIYAVSAYQNLAIDKITDSSAKTFFEKEGDILQEITQSLKFAQVCQDFGLKPPQWQNVNHVFLMAISHLDFLNIKHEVMLDSLEIFADPLLEKVFQILANNTLTYGEKATQVTLRYAQNLDSITLFFEDNGVGISTDMKDKIFLLDIHNKKPVGLFLTREILDITGITIKETGEPGKGARFEIRVPKGVYRLADQK